jgi:hypothetical protein
MGKAFLHAHVMIPYQAPPDLHMTNVLTTTMLPSIYIFISKKEFHSGTIRCNKGIRNQM